jgi:hypothetical protein
MSSRGPQALVKALSQPPKKTCIFDFWEVVEALEALWGLVKQVVAKGLHMFGKPPESIEGIKELLEIRNS